MLVCCSIVAEIQLSMTGLSVQIEAIAAYWSVGWTSVSIASLIKFVRITMLTDNGIIQTTPWIYQNMIHEECIQITISVIGSPSLETISADYNITAHCINSVKIHRVWVVSVESDIRCLIGRSGIYKVDLGYMSDYDEPNYNFTSPLTSIKSMWFVNWQLLLEPTNS